jgi:hypothetical protein
MLITHDLSLQYCYTLHVICQFTTKIRGKTSLGPLISFCKISFPVKHLMPPLCRNWPFSPPKWACARSTCPVCEIHMPSVPDPQAQCEIPHANCLQSTCPFFCPFRNFCLPNQACPDSSQAPHPAQWPVPGATLHNSYNRNNVPMEFPLPSPNK